MQTFVSILRGINVSGHRKIAMAELKEMYSTLKFTHIVTYIQSGNVIFQSSQRDTKKLAQLIQQNILKKFSFEVPVIIITAEELKSVLKSNPFLKQENIEEDKLHVTFLDERPKQQNIDVIKILDFSPDQFIIAVKEVYLHCPSGYGNTKLNNTFFENKLKVTATTRNWKTVNKLVELASG